MITFLEKRFELSKNRTNLKQEFLAGLITFLTMSYILAVNPAVLGDAGMDKKALFTTTALATIIATFLMGFFAKLPIAQAPGMGLNVFFTYTVVLTMGYSWQFALTAVFIEGIIFLLLTIIRVRELIVVNIPKVLKDAIPVGIGLFITLIGLKNAGIVIGDKNTLVRLGDFGSHSVWIALIGLITTGILLIRKVNGAILIGIVAATVFGIILGDVGLPSTVIDMPPSMAPILGQAVKPLFAPEGWHQIFSFNMLIVVFTFLFINLFDSLGTIIGVMEKMGLQTTDGNYPRMKEALVTDAVGTTVGSLLGTSPISTYVESASGVVAGGRTGLTAISVAAMFALALFFSPLFLMIPSAATAPALIIIGLFMMEPIRKIDFNKYSEGLPAFITIILMPFTYSIAEGIVFGILAFTIFKSFSKERKDVTITMYILAVLFIAKIILDVVYR